MSKRAADDTDSPMLDEDSSAASSNPQTPPNTTAATTATHFASELSPPDSQNLAPQNPPSAPSPFTPLSARGAPANAGKKMAPSEKLNANGKREWESQQSKNEPANAGLEKAKAASSSAASGSVTNGTSHGAYKWDREEDAPGYAWSNAKAKEEFARAWATVVDKDRAVGNRYGDVLLQK